MKTYTAHFRTEAEQASHEIEAKTPKQALRLARKLWETDPDQLVFEKYDMMMPPDEIEIEGDEGSERATWCSDDMRLRLAAADMRDALELCEDVLSELARLDDGTPSVSALHAARAALAKAKGGAP